MHWTPYLTEVAMCWIVSFSVFGVLMFFPGFRKFVIGDI